MNVTAFLIPDIHDVDLSIHQQNILNKMFCVAVEDLLIKSEFPVTEGLKNCYASIM